MAEHRPFAPSARRRAIARAAGLHAASPLLVAAGALVAVSLAIAAAGRAASRVLGTWIADACQAPALPHHEHATGLAPAVLELALPVLAVAALAALVVHIAQLRAVWMPRRSVPGAPAVPPARVQRTAFELATAFIIGGVTLGWLWAMAPRLAALVEHPLAGAVVVAAFLATLAIAYVALGAADSLLRHAAHAAALRMTHAEQREDARLAGADPRWRKARADAARTRAPRTDDQRARDALAGASILILGEDGAASNHTLAIAVAWDPHRRPVPTRTAVGRDARATQLLGLARRHGIPVHRDVALAAALATADGPVPEAHWPRLAELVAAARPRT